MKLIKGFLVVFTLLTTTFVVQAQEYQEGQIAPFRLMYKANKAFNQLDFDRAIELYKKILVKYDEPEAVLRLADCYRLIGDPVDAEVWYERTLNYYPDDPLSVLYYAQTLQQNAKYAEAKTFYQKFDDLTADDMRGVKGVQACEQAEQLMNRPPLFASSNLPINSKANDYAPAFYKDGITFVSDRSYINKVERIFRWDGGQFSDIYVTGDRLGRWSQPQLLKGLVNTRYHEGPHVFSEDEKELFYTQNQFDPQIVGAGSVEEDEWGAVRLKIMSAWFDERKKEWGPGRDFPYNFAEYSVAHPALSYDGKWLFFASDMEGGEGGVDIYRCKFDGGYWSTPENLGPEINTEGDEMFPYIAYDSTLYFTSNVHPGLGGHDVFKAHYNEEEDKFERIWNLGTPVNSSRDDMSFIIDEFNQRGYFASNHPKGMGGDDIYTANAKAIYLEVKVRDKNTFEELKDVKISLFEGSGARKPYGSAFTDHDGRFFYAINEDKTFRFVANKRGYNDVRETFSTRDMKNGESVYIEVWMESSLDIRMEGLVVERQYKLPIPNATVVLTNFITGESDSLVTSEDGYFSFALYPGIEYNVTARAAAYTWDELDFSTYDIMGNKVINQTLELEGPIPDIFRDFYHLYFDLDKHKVKPETSPDLAKILRILKLNQSLNVEISAHTDSRASDKYNEALSQKRAQSVVDYLVRNGIAANRLKAKGYGEYRLKNKCTNGVRCTDLEHERNRRVEMTVLDNNGQAIVASRESKVYNTNLPNRRLRNDAAKRGTSRLGNYNKIPVAGPSGGSEGR